MSDCNCPHCGNPLNLGSLMGSRKSDAKAAASKANGAAPVKPGSRPRGRPKKPRNQEAENTKITQPNEKE
jgi:hypothetical protein